MTDFQQGDIVKQVDGGPGVEGDLLLVAGPGEFPQTIKVRDRRGHISGWDRTRFVLAAKTDASQKLCFNKNTTYSDIHRTTTFPVRKGDLVVYSHPTYRNDGTVYVSEVGADSYYANGVARIARLSDLTTVPVEAPAVAPTLLDQAKDLIYGDRQDAYGDWADNAEAIVKQFEIILQPELNGSKIPVEKAALLIDGLKTVRLAQNPTHTDSWVDKAGYAGLAGELTSIWPVLEAVMNAYEPELDPLTEENVEGQRVRVTRNTSLEWSTQRRRAYKGETFVAGKASTLPWRDGFGYKPTSVWSKSGNTLVPIDALERV